MSTAARIPLAQAEQEAADFRALFDGTHVEWVIAGSIRRRKPDVGDVEHVVIPILGESGELFGAGKPDWSRHAVRDRALQLICRGTIRLHRYGDGGGSRFGDRLMGFDFNGRTHEVFCCERGNFGPILAIRTGSADFSKCLVTRLRDFGYRQEEGWLKQYKIFEHGRPGYEPVHCPTEADYFRAAGYDSVPDPSTREISA